ncbi:DNA-binding transcriptional LysR family regulator [Litoreibacter halocynthiae]|uniref:DNA-binding transcriptional LysR family regulator n=1 Tax=Litoreibacter halocynthiae TaxID=1242689 RepID=A0A4R7LL21_9RHOB|nr:LysR family transcriptional regulator [Litoreibacter halocynthiae]TDT75372.1 DNA-binding transcriptional LysR family regulator [Litoreibacter halocynthiae]
MDITLVKTFLEVAATGSFVAASERLFVTQSAVSLRIQRLEDSLGRPLFNRSKAGAVLTPAGTEFERYALGLIKLWEEARQQIAIPEGFTKSLTIGAQYSLWPRLGFRWIDALRAEMPSLSIRTELGMPDRLTRFLIEGVVQAGLMYNPQLRSGLSVSKVSDEELVLVASWANPSLDQIDGRYVFIDWGAEFTQAHAIELPHLINSGLTLSLGAMAAEFIVKRQYAGYLPARYIKQYVDAGRLHLIPDAPRFPYPAYVVWRDDLDAEVADVARKTLQETVEKAILAQDEVINRLSEISIFKQIPILGG